MAVPAAARGPASGCEITAWSLVHVLERRHLEVVGQLPARRVVRAIAVRHHAEVGVLLGSPFSLVCIKAKDRIATRGCDNRPRVSRVEELHSSPHLSEEGSKDRASLSFG
jgi:hypothetical protein